MNRACFNTPMCGYIATCPDCEGCDDCCQCGDHAPTCSQLDCFGECRGCDDEDDDPMADA